MSTLKTNNAPRRLRLKTSRDWAISAIAQCFRRRHLIRYIFSLYIKVTLGWNDFNTMNNSLDAYCSILVDYLRPQRGRMVVLALLIFSNIGLQLANPQIMRHFIDKYKCANPRQYRAVTLAGAALHCDCVGTAGSGSEQYLRGRECELDSHQLATL